MTYVPKPHRQAYDGFLARQGIDPARAIMFDDLEKNLLVPHETGMVTVPNDGSASRTRLPITPRKMTKWL